MCVPRGGGNLSPTRKNQEEEVVPTPDADVETTSSSDDELPPILGRIIFILNNLPFDAEIDDGFADPAEVDDDPEHPHYLHYLAKTYLLPLEKILLGSLKDNGLVTAIYINFGDKGFYEHNPISMPPTTVPAFEHTLRDVFSGVRMEDPWTHELLWRQITDDDLPTLISDVPEKCRIIGCLTGEQIEGSDSIKYDTYIRDAPSDQCFIFVVGQIVDEEIKPLIDDFVEVSETEMDAYDCLERISGAMQLKFLGWGH